MSFEWRHSRAGNRYCKRGVFLCTVFPDQRKGGYAYVISNTENDRKEFGNDFETEDDALYGVEQDFAAVTARLSEGSIPPDDKMEEDEIPF